MNDYTPYQQRIRECFAATYRFLDENKHARTDEDWKRISDTISTRKDTDPLTVDLIVAAVKEIEREYNAATGKEGDTRNE